MIRSVTPFGCSDSFILSLAIACRKYEQLTMPFIEKLSSAARRGTVLSNRYFVCGENCSFRRFKFVAPSLVVADPDAEVDGYDVDDLTSPRCCFSRCRFNPLIEPH